MIFAIIYILGCVLTYGVLFAYVENEYPLTGGVQTSDFIFICMFSCFSLVTLLATIIACAMVGSNVFKHGIQFTKNK